MATMMLVLMGSDLDEMGTKLMLMLSILVIIMGFWVKSGHARDIPV